MICSGVYVITDLRAELPHIQIPLKGRIEEKEGKKIGFEGAW